MSKKSVLIFCVCVLALSGVFAGTAERNSVDLGFAPSPRQMIKVGGDVYTSDSGLAASAGYSRTVRGGLYVGCGLEWSNYKQYKLEDYGSFNNVAALARCGYRFGLSEKVFADGGLGLGYELSIVGKNTSGSFVIELDGHAGVIVDDVFSLIAGAKARAAIQSRTGAYSVLPYAGASISF